nr:MAG TPA: hypothetical protein [Caudoviricetes sp.]
MPLLFLCNKLFVEKFLNYFYKSRIIRNEL